MIERHKLGMLLFISSEAVFFGALIVTYILNRTGIGSQAAALLDLPRTALFSIALFASSATIELAHRRLNRDDPRGLRNWIVATVVLGAIFLAGQAWDYIDLIRENVTPSTGVYTSAVYTLTGFHSLHVAVGLVLLLTYASVADAIRHAQRRANAFVPVSLYWHFVDAVWVVIFALVFLWAPR